MITLREFIEMQTNHNSVTEKSSDHSHPFINISIEIDGMRGKVNKDTCEKFMNCIVDKVFFDFDYDDDDYIGELLIYLKGEIRLV